MRKLVCQHCQSTFAARGAADANVLLKCPHCPNWTPAVIARSTIPFAASIAVFMLFVAAIALIIFATSRSHVVIEDFNEARTPSAVMVNDVQATADYYAKRDIGGGWTVHSFHAAATVIEADLAFESEDQACAFRDDPADRRQNIVSVACPYDRDYLWDTLKEARDIVLVMRCRGEIFARHSCKAAHPSGALLKTAIDRIP